MNCWRGLMRQSNREDFVRLDINEPEFLDDLFEMDKADRHSALETLKKLRRMTWDQVYRDNGLKWEKIKSVAPPAGVPAMYSLRISQSRRVIAYRDGEFLRLLAIPPDHDSTYGKK
jgi:hypothetical protein